DEQKRIFHLKPTSALLKAGSVKNGEFQNIGAFGIGRYSSWIADGWTGWIDENGSFVTSSTLVVLDSTGNIKLKDGITSAAVRSPVIDTQKDTGRIKSISFSAEEFPELVTGSRQVIDYDGTTITREVRFRGQSAPFSATDISPAWQQAYKNNKIDGPSTYRYIQIEMTLRLNAK
ncbi:MAG: hypothetical protein AB1633_11105, partial [Elusimicrobiota bacterium]